MNIHVQAYINVEMMGEQKWVPKYVCSNNTRQPRRLVLLNWQEKVKVKSEECTKTG